VSLEPLQKRSILDSLRFITSSNMAAIPSPFLSSCARARASTSFSLLLSQDRTLSSLAKLQSQRHPTLPTIAQIRGP